MSDVIQNTRAVCERNRRDYQELAKMTGQTIAQIEADTTAPDLPEEAVITEEDARALVKTLRSMSARNADERDDHAGKYWKGQSDGRASAYKLAAGCLEELILDEETDGE